MKRACMIVILSVLGYGTFAQDLMTISVDNVEISMPVGWLAQYTKSPQLFYLYSPLEPDDTFQENCNLAIEYLPINYSVEDYMALASEQLSPIYTDLEIVTTSENCHMLTGSISGITLQQSQYFYIRDQVAYILTFSATPKTYGRFSVAFEEIAATFKIE